MAVTPTTTARRMKHCRFLYRPWRVPTLVSYPPPPPPPMREPVRVRPRDVDLPPQPAPLPYRSTRERRRRDCVFIPDMDVALQFIEARRRALDVAPTRDHAAPGLLETPLALGLLMTVAPPVAVTLVWSSERFSRAAQIALTAYGALVTLVLAALALVALW